MEAGSYPMYLGCKPCVLCRQYCLLESRGIKGCPTGLSESGFSRGTGENRTVISKCGGGGNDVTEDTEETFGGGRGMK